MVRSIFIDAQTPESPLVRKAAEILRREIDERCGAAICTDRPGEATVILSTRTGVGEQGFNINDAPGGAVSIVGNDDRGLLYGVGKFLRASRFDDGRFTPGAWRGTSVPIRPIRGMYFASHFHNFYHDAPIPAVQRYVEELALWGCNALAVWFDMHHFNGINDPAAQAHLHRLREILRTAKGVGMETSLTTLANEGYANSPEAWRAKPTGWAHYGVELCPSIPEARALILKWHEERLEAFRDVGVDHIWVWPYDQGGCGCDKCMPWGAKGFLDIGEQEARLFRRMYPNGKVILSTWLFDWGDKPRGEYEGLARAFAIHPDWVDYLMVDSHGDFPTYILEHGVPANLPLLNFPEISMWGCGPWGGFGATPLPGRFERLWKQVGSRLSGGFPYSEGIFEDINKAIELQFYWGDRPAEDTLREYAAYEYSPDVAADVVAAVRTLEANHERIPAEFNNGRFHMRADARGVERGVYKLVNPDAGAEAAYLSLSGLDGMLPAHARRAWRWRILLLRSLIDRELHAHAGLITADADKALLELVNIYHAQNAESPVKPPHREWMATYNAARVRG